MTALSQLNAQPYTGDELIARYVDSIISIVAGEPNRDRRFETFVHLLSCVTDERLLEVTDVLTEETRRRFGSQDALTGEVSNLYLSFLSADELPGDSAPERLAARGRKLIAAVRAGVERDTVDRIVAAVSSDHFRPAVPKPTEVEVDIEAAIEVKRQLQQLLTVEQDFLSTITRQAQHQVAPPSPSQDSRIAVSALLTATSDIVGSVVNVDEAHKARIAEINALARSLAAYGPREILTVLGASLTDAGAKRLAEAVDVWRDYKQASALEPEVLRTALNDSNQDVLDAETKKRLISRFTFRKPDQIVAEVAKLITDAVIGPKNYLSSASVEVQGADTALRSARDTCRQAAILGLNEGFGFDLPLSLRQQAVARSLTPSLGSTGL